MITDNTYAVGHGGQFKDGSVGSWVALCGPLSAVKNWKKHNLNVPDLLLSCGSYTRPSRQFGNAV